jgi:hypothetical protein
MAPQKAIQGRCSLELQLQSHLIEKKETDQEGDLESQNHVLHVRSQHGREAEPFPPLHLKKSHSILQLFLSAVTLHILHL